MRREEIPRKLKIWETQVYSKKKPKKSSTYTKAKTNGSYRMFLKEIHSRKLTIHQSDGLSCLLSNDESA
jgi:hypothetical protein